MLALVRPSLERLLDDLLEFLEVVVHEGAGRGIQRVLVVRRAEQIDEPADDIVQGVRGLPVLPHHRQADVPLVVQVRVEDLVLQLQLRGVVRVVGREVQGERVLASVVQALLGGGHDDPHLHDVLLVRDHLH